MTKDDLYKIEDGLMTGRTHVVGKIGQPGADDQESKRFLESCLKRIDSALLLVRFELIRTVPQNGNP